MEPPECSHRYMGLVFRPGVGPHMPMHCWRGLVRCPPAAPSTCYCTGFLPRWPRLAAPPPCLQCVGMTAKLAEQQPQWKCPLC